MSTWDFRQKFCDAYFDYRKKRGIWQGAESFETDEEFKRKVREYSEAQTVLFKKHQEERDQVKGTDEYRCLTREAKLNERSKNGFANSISSFLSPLLKMFNSGVGTYSISPQ